MQSSDDPAPFARSYAPVAASSSSDSFELDGASATRWRAGVLQSRIPAAPRFRYDRPSKDLLDEQVQGYVEITGDPVRTDRPNKRNLIATCYRVHGPDFLPYVADYFRVKGSAQNLLGVLRQAAPRLAEDGADRPIEEPVRRPTAIASQREPTVSAGHVGMPCPIDHSRPGVVYCVDHRPVFDPTSTRRYDRRLSNPQFGHLLDAPE